VVFKFLLRPLGIHDFGDVRRIAAENWGGQDYLPHKFQEWLEDDGLLIGVEECNLGELVALAHVALLPDGTAWLEGLRVRSDFRNQGLSRMIMKQQMEYALDLKDNGLVNRIASTTYIKNETSIHLSLSSGFKLYGSNLIVSWNPKGELEDVVEVEPWKPTLEELQSLPYFQHTKQHILQFFVVQQLNEQWWQDSKNKVGFYRINGARGWLDERIEPHCVILEPTVDGMIGWLHYTTFKTGEDANTVIYPDTNLIEELKKTNLLAWTDWIPDCLYFVYDPE
jgi:GNAT superfamily N-acetyltransferase